MNYIEKSNLEKNNIINLDKYLTQKEKKFRRNVSQQILKNSKINDQLIDNVSSLRQKINDNYIELSKSKYNLYDTNRNNMHTLIKDNIIKLENVNNDKDIYDLNEEIDNIKNEIEKLKKQTILFINYYLEIKDDVNCMKKQCKILPELIDNLENENKNLSYMQNIMHSNIQKIKSKLYGFEINKSKIERNLEQLITFYDEYN
jgi:chromosome segregation ATPase